MTWVGWWRWCALSLVIALAGCGSKARGHGDGDGDDDDDGGTGDCVDIDGDRYGEGPGCEGDDCDEGNPERQSGCGEDCDALPQDVGCPCAEESEVVACFDGDPALAGVEPCATGLKHCIDGEWEACFGQRLPVDEDPLGRNGIDDDCNGLVDDRLCGETEACGEECCQAGQVCYGTYCDVPGDCAVDGNCDDDTHCTGDGCIPYQAGELNEQCDGDIVDPIEPIDEFEPDLQCQWVGDASMQNVIVPTLVVELDGVLDDAYEPEIVFSAASFSLSDAHIVAIDGATCDERWRSDEGGIEACGPLAVGDLDGDGFVEIAAPTSTAGVAVFDTGGNELWRTDGGSSTGCSDLTPTLIANLDGAGDAEVLRGLTAYDSAGDVIWSDPEPKMAPWGIVPVVADVDLDGAAEVITGNRILSGDDGGVEQDFGHDNGQPGIADFDRSTPEPEIAVIAPSGARIQTVLGDVIFGPNTALVANGFYGGPPVIADFDGDGEAEFGAAGATTYAVFDPDCTNDWARDGECVSGRDDGILWEKGTQDASSGSTGSSVFDFDFDGVAEVVYNDECFTRIYDGLTGESRFVRSNSTGTAYEYPIIADVDGDGQTEIAVSANNFVGFCPNDAETGEPFGEASVGVKVWRDVLDRWAPSRRIWNQHSYDVTNVEESGAIPAVPEHNWSVAGLNNYRVNTRDDPGSAERGVDMTVRGDSWDDNCGASVVLHATVANRGIRRAPRGLAVTFDVDGEVVCEVRTEVDIEPGATLPVSCEWLLPETIEPVNVHVLVDAGDALVECEEDNNDATIADVWCETIG